ncbi:MAG: WD40/YVTN/BNR-like repeat-containing protein [Acidobacteriaceae bacterium]
MNKILVLILGLSLTAAGCNILGSGSTGNTGAKGVLKSDDGGKNFLLMNTVNKKANISGVSVNTLIFDSKNSDIVYLGASDGIYKSIDAAGTWNKILQGMAVSDMAADTFSGDVIYAAGMAGANGKLIKSPDGGATWTDLYTEPSKTASVASVTVSKANSKILMAGLSTGEIIRSTDGGLTWQVVKKLADTLVSLRFYNTTTAYALTLTKGLNKSTDQGSSWEALPISTSTNADNINSMGISRYLDMAFDRKLSSVIFLATDAGLMRSVDNGATWSTIYLPVKDTSLKVTATSVHPSDSNTIFIAIGSTMLKSTNGGVTWETIKVPTGQTVRQILINPTSTNIIYLGMGNKK